MKNLKNLLAGLKQVLVLDNGERYVRPSSNDFFLDASALRGDSQKVISDLNKATKKNVEQIKANKR